MIRSISAALAVTGALLGQSGECSSALDSGRQAYERRQFTLAITHFTTARLNCGNERAVLMPLAQAQLMAQRLNDSVATLDALLAFDRHNSDALKLKADVVYLLGRERDAEALLREVLSVDANHAPSQYALGRIYYQQNRFPEATRLFQSLIERNPNDYRAHDNLALCFSAMGQDSDALRHFKHALDLVHKDHPEYDTAYADTANFFLTKGEYEKAFQLAAEAAKRNPDSARNFFLTGKALVSLQKDELSLRWFKRAAELEPTYAEAFYWLARLHRKLGNTEEATRALDRFRELNDRPKLKR